MCVGFYLFYISDQVLVDYVLVIWLLQVYCCGFGLLDNYVGVMVLCDFLFILVIEVSGVVGCKWLVVVEQEYEELGDFE